MTFRQVVLIASLVALQGTPALAITVCDYTKTPPCRDTPVYTIVKPLENGKYSLEIKGLDQETLNSVLKDLKVDKVQQEKK